MTILIIGGTNFYGRHVTERLIAAGHDVTLFHRGRTNPDLFPEAEHIHGDRRVEADLDRLKGRHWDALFDPSAYFPRDVELLLDRVDGQVEHYTFVSSISVYGETGATGPSEESPVGELTDEMSTDTITPENYGPLKVAAECVAAERMMGKTLIIRPGLIVGPNDPTDRFTWWLWRIAAGGRFPMPGDGAEPVQFIDVRDLAAWTVKMIEERATGVYNATGPAEPLPMRTFIETAVEVIGSGAVPVPVTEEILERHEVAPFSELPLWVPAAYNGMSRTSIARAVDAGLTFRPLEETVRETLDWFAEVDRAREGNLRAGLGREKEEAVMASMGE